MPIEMQNAYLHLVIEAILLKIGGMRAKKDIQALKATGVKTEPAFAQYFGIEGDPYVALRKIALNVLSHGLCDSFVRTQSGGVTVRPPAPVADEILSAMGAFCREMLVTIQKHGLQEQIIEMDHACYRVADLSKYELLKSELESVGELLSEAFVNGRPIATYKLYTPIELDDGFSVDALELPAPKPGRSYSNGFEHVEFVTKDSLKSFMGKLPNLSLDVGNLHAKINPDVSVKFDSGLVKFHEASLEQVIAREKAALLKDSVRPVVVLDFDDTLVVSRTPFLRAVHQALEAYLGHKIDYATVVDGARPTFPEFFSNFEIKDPAGVKAVVELFKKAWQTERHACAIPLGMRSMLSCLKSEGIGVVIWTARDKDTAQDFITNSGLEPFIGGIFAFDGPNPGKPQVSPALAAQIKGCRGVVIGDSKSDADGARSLGLPFIQAAWVHRAALGCDTVCDSPLEALATSLKILRDTPSVTPMPHLETRRLLLTPLKLEDAPSYQRHFVDYEVIRHHSSRVPWPYPENGVVEFFKNVLLPPQGNDRWTWALRLKSTPDEIIGCVDLWREGRPENRGFWLGRKFWDQGYMTEAVEPIMDYAFDSLGFETLTFANAVGNERSRRIKEKTGAKLVTVKPASFVDPQYTEHEIWELTKADWLKFRKTHAD